MRKCPYCNQYTDERSRRCMFCGRIMDLELTKKLQQEKASRERLARQARTALVSFFSIAGIAAFTIWAGVFSPVGSKVQRQAATQTAAVLQFCDPNAVALAAHELIDMNDRWADIVSLAVSVDREAVVVQVDRLQKIRRDARDVKPPPCLTSAHESLIDGMDAHINGFLEYARGETVEAVNNHIMRGNIEMNAFADEVERVQRCVPDCR